MIVIYPPDSGCYEIEAHNNEWSVYGRDFEALLRAALHYDMVYSQDEEY